MNTLELTEPEKPATKPARQNSSKGVVVLPYGLLGFERVKNYSLLTKPDEAPFLWFQMLQDPKHAFLVLPPAAAVPDYQPDLDDQDVEFLELDDPSDAFILNIVTLRGARKGHHQFKRPHRHQSPDMDRQTSHPGQRRPVSRCAIHCLFPDLPSQPLRHADSLSQTR